MAAAEPIRDKKQLRRMAEYWLGRGSARNYAMIVLGACTALRIADLLGLRWGDVYDIGQGRFRPHIYLLEKKTGKQKTVALSLRAIEALRMCLPGRKGEFLFPNNRKGHNPLSRVQAWRILRAAAEAVKAVGQISCHSLRKTFGYFAWKAGALPVVLMDIYNHSSFEVTRRYLGITQDDRDRVYLDLAIW